MCFLIFQDDKLLSRVKRFGAKSLEVKKVRTFPYKKSIDSHNFQRKPRIFIQTKQFPKLPDISHLTVDKQVEGNRESPAVFFFPSFATKVTEYLCSGWVFFSSDKFRLFN